MKKRGNGWSRLLGCGLMLALAGCGSGVYVEPGASGNKIGAITPVDRGPLFGLDPTTIPDARPRAEPLSAAGNKSPYTVLGKTYHVLPSSEGYARTGVASWYGAKFHGNRTSNGEVYSMYGMTAAHRTLPLPSYVRVTRLDNGRSVVVRVNDRGPFKDDRLIDLSYAAATKLGYVDQGTARVRVEAIDTASASTPVAPSRDGVSGLSGRFLQVGAFSSEVAARRLRGNLDTLTRYPVIVVPVREAGLFKVRIGPILTDAEVLRVQQLLAAGDYGRAMIVLD